MHKEKPILSVAMATYNGELFLEEQIQSILNQSFQNFELIICDDCSTDKTAQIIQKYMQTHSNIKLFKNETNIGFIKNFEKLISLCETPYIALSDQDDIWLENKLEIQMKAMKKAESLNNNSPLMVHSDLMMINEEGKHLQNSFFKYKKYKLKDAKDLGQILGPCGVMGNTILFNQALKDKILPFPSCLEVHDYWIAVMTELLGERITMRQPLVKYRIHNENASNTIVKYASKTYSIQKSINFFRKKSPLPYLSSHRSDVIEYILENYTLEKNDMALLKVFHRYLQKSSLTLSLLLKMFKYDFIKRDGWYRLKFLFLYLYQ